MIIEGWLKTYLTVISFICIVALLIQENTIKPLDDKHVETCKVIVGVSFFLMAIPLFPLFFLQIYRMFF